MLTMYHVTAYVLRRLTNEKEKRAAATRVFARGCGTFYDFSINNLLVNDLSVLHEHKALAPGGSVSVGKEL